ncbi:MAG: ABC transporter permease [Acidimicrobiales bacterium]
MVGFLLRRFGQSAIVLIIVSVITFTLIHLLPGSPAKAELGLRATPATIATFNRINGFNKPLWYQYGLYVDHLLHGNLGYSYADNAYVSQLFLARFPKSMLLVGLALLLAILVAIPLGMFQAVRRNTVGDYVLTGSSFVLYSFPTFWMGFVLIAMFSISLHLFPPVAPSGNSVGQILSQPAGLVLPVLTLSVVSIAAFSRYMRSSMIDSMTQDYIRTARAKGSSRLRVVFIHALRNSLIPMATLIGLSLPAILGGALVTEEVFNYPGVGLLFFQAAGKSDFPVLIGITLVGAVGVVVGNLLADIAYGVLDPRIRY